MLCAVGADGLYLSVLPFTTESGRRKDALQNRTTIILILEVQILCRPKVGVDGLYLSVLPIHAKRVGAKYAL